MMSHIYTPVPFCSLAVRSPSQQVSHLQQCTTVTAIDTDAVICYRIPLTGKGLCICVKLHAGIFPSEMHWQHFLYDIVEHTCNILQQLTT